ncbi:MAG: hypothetical protein ACOY0T_21010 [Myxococcota bacterium]
MATQQPNNSRQGAGKQQAGGRRPPATTGSGASGSTSATAARDETYGLISVLYHSLQGAETYAQYIADAQRAGASELVEFFRECQEEENARAKRAKELLADQLVEEDEDEDEEDEDEDDEDEDDDEDA